MCSHRFDLIIGQMEVEALAARIYLHPLTLFFPERRNKTRV